MRILFTGASSFTGFWFVSQLAKAGHTIIAPLRGAISDYTGVRRQRIELISKSATLIENCAFGTDVFMTQFKDEIDVLCHHAAEVSNYKSLDFNIAEALKRNTLNLQEVLRVARSQNLKAVVLTGSVFEPDEGTGNAPMRAFSPYGLSKGLTAQVFKYWCNELTIPLAKFVIPNPFGPWEDERFCAYLMRCWLQRQSAVINTPGYVRDNIHVSLLALAYSDLVSKVEALPIYSRLGPSGYVESQGAFAQRFAREIGARLQISAEVHLAVQTEFPEPVIRINTDIPDHQRLGWSEQSAWDELANYYDSLTRSPN